MLHSQNKHSCLLVMYGLHTRADHFIASRSAAIELSLQVTFVIFNPVLLQELQERLSRAERGGGKTNDTRLAAYLKPKVNPTV